MSNFNAIAFTGSGSWTTPAGIKSVIVDAGGADQSSSPPTFNSISAGTFGQSYALKANGEVWSWGVSSNGVLGDNTAQQRSVPVSVVGGHSFMSISGIGNSAIALKADGTAWTWGLNASGQLGDNSSINKSSPVSVVGGHSFIQVKSGSTHLTSLKIDGSVWCWGLNASGQLGDNTVLVKSSPIQVVGAHSFVKIASGQTHSLALKANGEVWTWGLNATGQLGDNTVVAKSSPVSVVGGHSFIDINGGISHSIALKANGEVWAWGNNANGQLGNNTILNTSSPVQVVGAHSFVKIGQGIGGHNLALKADGSAWAWGFNSGGQLGNNAVTLSMSSPIAVVGGHSFSDISAGGGNQSVAIKLNGEVWCWGAGGSGALGNNLTAARSSPVLIRFTGSSFLNTVTKTRLMPVTEGAVNTITISGNYVSFNNILIGQGDRLNIMWVE
jgi:alpha-tubulin suppressor-like RCC1 family protein